MRVLFVSSTTGGGSGRSQRDLAELLITRGHEVRFLADDKRGAPLRRWVGEQLVDAEVRLRGRPGHGLARAVRFRPGRRPELSEVDGLAHELTVHPENAFTPLVARWRPDIVVANSIARVSWKVIREECARSGIPTVLYLREVTSFGHLDSLPDPGDALVANAESLVAGARARGHPCAFVPSAVDTSPTQVESDRSVALLINPIESHGIDTLWQIARALPDLPFVVQESWPLDGAQVDRISRMVDELGNVEFVRRVPPGPRLYGRARVLLVPHRIDNRPRVVVEAQANGIPVIASDFPGLVEVVGDGGVTLPPDDPGGWIAALGALWADPEGYATLSEVARTHAARDEVRPGWVVDRFEEVLALAVARCARRQSPG
jgi:glycosyltransferase involved in cell wall biosynthesis